MNSSPFWNEDWMQTQQKYWQQWHNMGRQTMGTQQDIPSPWEMTMDHWWQAVAPIADTNGRDFMEKMLAQSKEFFRLGSTLLQNLQENENWTEALNHALEQLQNQINQAAQQANVYAKDNIQQWMDFCQNPLTQWQKVTNELPGSMHNLTGSNPFAQVLGMPGLGYARENEESYKQLLQAGIDYQQKLFDYTQFFSDLGNLALQRMQEKVKALAAEEKSIDSIRVAYDLWVAASEEVYAARTMTPEYAKLHGELINALMVFKNQWNELQDQRLGAMGMPTRREVRTLQARLQDSRRTLQETQKGLQALTAQMTDLISAKTASTTTQQQPVASKVDSKKTAKKTTKKKASAKKPPSPVKKTGSPKSKAPAKKTSKKKAVSQKANHK